VGLMWRVSWCLAPPSHGAVGAQGDFSMEKRGEGGKGWCEIRSTGGRRGWRNMLSRPCWQRTKEEFVDKACTH